MRRHNSPFNGKRFILNKNTGEIHDLDKETANCQIDKIKPEHIVNCDTYEDAAIRAIFLSSLQGANGCHYCLPSKDNG